MGGRSSSGADLCEREGWYADGECDAFCVLEDADCVGALDGAVTPLDASRRMDSGWRPDAGDEDAEVDSGRGGMDGGWSTDDAAGGGDSGFDGGAPVVMPTASCDAPWAPVRGPATYATYAPRGRVSVVPVELDTGQTLLVEGSTLSGAPGALYLRSGPCKGHLGGPLYAEETVAGDGSFRMEYSATSTVNAYLDIGPSVERLEISVAGPTLPRSVGTVCTPGLTRCSGSTPEYCAWDGEGYWATSCGSGCVSGRCAVPTGESCADPIVVSAGAPFSGRVTAVHDDLFEAAISCSGARAFGRDQVFEIHLLAGQSLSASATNLESMGPDPVALYLLDACSDTTARCVGGNHAVFAALSHTATSDETLYLVVDTFDELDTGASEVEITVSP